MQRQTTLRIIGGKWRGRRIKVANQGGLRPSTDFVRETLFNWLTPVVDGAVCLDLFAGSGALGFEALSRGAKKVVMLDRSRKVVEMLKSNAESLKIDNAEIFCRTFSSNLKLPTENKFNLVFLDPPFRKNMITDACFWLEENNLLQNRSYIYLEAESELLSPNIPDNWECVRSKIAGQVAYSLWMRRPA
ncbi:MAG: 16S rRNA (guanine(966)-N(2))-methyltransferase RsmD [Gammaproteobacteria bacterium]|nr:16S rRNA (guanine(966)-N(2))-methyltransferase RsmD [Gammaproteobacteria bacterium]